jgi:protein-disulfide isomerase
MKMKICFLATLVLFAGCTSKDQLKKMLSEDPTILAEAIEKNPSVILEALNKAVRKAQEEEGKKRQDDEKKQLEDSYNNPLQPVIRADESIRGTKGAPLVLVEYSDFQCPYCSRGFETVLKLLEKFKGKIQFIYKHLPLDFHPQAKIASQYYEALRLQAPEKAFSFHDKIYKDQGKLKNGEAFLKEVAKTTGADMAKLAKDLNSEAVLKRIKEDEEEAKKYDFQGTPGFIFNGVPVKGAYPAEHFIQIAEELKKRGKVNY